MSMVAVSGRHGSVLGRAGASLSAVPVIADPPVWLCIEGAGGRRADTAGFAAKSGWSGHLDGTFGPCGRHSRVDNVARLTFRRVPCRMP